MEVVVNALKSSGLKSCAPSGYKFVTKGGRAQDRWQGRVRLHAVEHSCGVFLTAKEAAEAVATYLITHEHVPEVASWLQEAGMPCIPCMVYARAYFIACPQLTSGN